MHRSLRLASALVLALGATACGDQPPTAPAAPDASAAAVAVEPSAAFAPAFAVTLSYPPYGPGTQVSWTPVSGANVYHVYRDTGSGVQHLGTTSGTSLIDPVYILSKGGQPVTWSVSALYEPPNCGQPPYPCDPVYFGTASRTALALPPR